MALPAWGSTCDPETGECLPTTGVAAQDCATEGLICKDGACVAPEDDACIPGESFDAGDGCNTCSCPESGLKSDAICTEIACPEDPCAGKACGANCSTCVEGEACPAVDEYCDAQGQCNYEMPTCG